MIIILAKCTVPKSSPNMYCIFHPIQLIFKMYFQVAINSTTPQISKQCHLLHNSRISNRMDNNKKKKTSRGRQKIEIKKIKNEAARQVAFTKRRQGVIKKASELATLCGIDIAIVAFSPAGKPFSFGQPSVETIINRFLSQVDTNIVFPMVPPPTESLAIELLNLQCMEIELQLKAAREKKAMLEDRLRMAVEAMRDMLMEKVLIGQKMEELGIEEMERIRRVLEHAKWKVETKLKDVALFPSTALQLTNTSVHADPVLPLMICELVAANGEMMVYPYSITARLIGS